MDFSKTEEQADCEPSCPGPLTVASQGPVRSCLARAPTNWRSQERSAVVVETDTCFVLTRTAADCSVSDTGRRSLHAHDCRGRDCYFRAGTRRECKATDSYCFRQAAAEQHRSGAADVERRARRQGIGIGDDEGSFPGPWFRQNKSSPR